MKSWRPFVLLAIPFLVVFALCAAWLYVQKQQYDRNRDLIAALQHGDTKSALVLVNAGADPNTRLKPLPAPTFQRLLYQMLHHTPPPVNQSPTALMLACGIDWYSDGKSQETLPKVSEDLPLLRAMLAHQASIRATTNDGLQPLHLACVAERLPTIELLLQHGADINAEGDGHTTSLMFSADQRTGKVMRLLLAHGADTRVQNLRGFTALHFAVFTRGALVNVPLLMAHGADPNQRDKSGRSPLEFARKHRPHLVALLTRGAK